MPLTQRIRKYLSGPQGRRLTEKGKRMATDPHYRQRARGMLSRLRGRG